LPAAQRSLFAPPWPELAIGCGRSAALLTRIVRPLSGGRCYTVQILDPRIDPRHWDAVIAPRHDGLDGANVLRPLGSLNTVDARWLADGRDACPLLGELPQPRVGVLLGGPRRGIDLDDDYADRLLGHLLARHRREGGSLLVLASRRTPAELIELFRATLRDVPGIVWAGPDDGRNPFPGVLGWADRLVVTPDSVNMLSEACAVGCPVHTLATAPLPARIARFHQTLRAANLLHDIDDTTASTQPPLRETAALAGQLLARMAQRRGD
jgi:mitochondrial fission protein ELM1